MRKTTSQGHLRLRLRHLARPVSASLSSTSRRGRQEPQVVLASNSKMKKAGATCMSGPGSVRPSTRACRSARSSSRALCSRLSDKKARSPLVRDLPEGGPQPSHIHRYPPSSGGASARIASPGAGVNPIRRLRRAGRPRLSIQTFLNAARRSPRILAHIPVHRPQPRGREPSATGRVIYLCRMVRWHVDGSTQPAPPVHRRLRRPSHTRSRGSRRSFSCSFRIPSPANRRRLPVPTAALASASATRTLPTDARVPRLHSRPRSPVPSPRNEHGRWRVKAAIGLERGSPELRPCRQSMRRCRRIGRRSPRLSVVGRRQLPTRSRRRSNRARCVLLG